MVKKSPKSIDPKLFEIEAKWTAHKQNFKIGSTLTVLFDLNEVKFIILLYELVCQFVYL